MRWPKCTGTCLCEIQDYTMLGYQKNCKCFTIETQIIFLNLTVWIAGVDTQVNRNKTILQQPEWLIFYVALIKITGRELIPISWEKNAGRMTTLDVRMPPLDTGRDFQTIYT